jgi:hypothetical protein
MLFGDLTRAGRFRRGNRRLRRGLGGNPAVIRGLGEVLDGARLNEPDEFTIGVLEERVNTFGRVGETESWQVKPLLSDDD